MKVIRLPAQGRPEPRCASFSDEEAVRRYERQMREHRAQVEAYEVTVLDDRVDGSYRVQGSTGVYLIDIVDGSGEVDSCTCPDFLTNDLGTCKHLEAVRRAIARSRLLREAYEALPARPERPMVAVEVRGGLRLVKRGPWTQSSLRKAGWRQETDGHLVPLVPAALTSPPANVGVVHAAAPVQARLAARAQLAARRERVKQAIAEGRLHLDRLTTTLWPFQREGAAHLVAQGRAMLADDLGLGKTVQALAACEALCAHGEADRVLVVAPASVVDGWAREVEQRTGSAPLKLGGDGAALKAGLGSAARYKIASYELVLRHADAFAALQPDVLVLDEAQRAKNFRARTAAVLRGIRSRFLFALTALPLDRHLDDLYALVQLVEPDLLSPLWRFNFTYYEQDARGRITAYKNLSRLRLLLAPLLVRRRKEEVAAQLPALTRQTRTTPLMPEQRSRSHEALGALAQALRPASPDGSALTTHLAQARAACADPSLLEPDDETVASPKLDELEQLVEEIVQQGPHRVLVFAEHAEPLRRAAARLERLGLSTIVLDRAQEEARRHLLSRRVTGHAEALVVLLTDTACARLELPAVTYHVHLDVPLGPGQLARRTAVGQRPGQRGLTEVFLSADGGVEAVLDAALLGRTPRPHESLERAVATGHFDAEALGLLRRLVDEAMPGALGATAGPAEDEEPPRTPPVAHLSLSPTPPSVLAAPLAPIEITGIRTVQGPKGPPTARPAATALPPVAANDEEPSPDTQRTRSHPGATRATLERSRDRLRLARVVLDAGFPSDAARAGYQALGLALRYRLARDGVTAPIGRDHEALVAALYRAFGAGSRLPPAVHGVLARLHDLGDLEEQGVKLDLGLAREAITEAEQWVERIAELPA